MAIRIEWLEVYIPIPVWYRRPKPIIPVEPPAWKRPKDMTPEELAWLPCRPRPLVLGQGVLGDDLLGFWQAVDGKWYLDDEQY